jgi:hypothetical protein
MRNEFFDDDDDDDELHELALGERRYYTIHAPRIHVSP